MRWRTADAGRGALVEEAYHVVCLAEFEVRLSPPSRPAVEARLAACLEVLTADERSFVDDLSHDRAGYGSLVEQIERRFGPYDHRPVDLPVTPLRVVD